MNKNKNKKFTPLNNTKDNLTGSRGFTLIEILVVIGIIAILAAIVIIAINPARQFAQARNSQRSSNINAILNAVGQYIADNKGILPTQITTTKQDISNTGANLCALLAPIYLPSLVVDPTIDPDGAGSLGTGQAIPSSACSGTYDTGYDIQKDTTGRITVFAPNAAESAIPGSAEISVTR
jgi:prepilin-type N-terminal cleavage/methylation domain-containing protein